MERERRGKGREGGKGKRKGRRAAIIFNKLSLGGEMDLAPQKKILAQHTNLNMLSSAQWRF